MRSWDSSGGPSAAGSERSFLARNAVYDQVRGLYLGEQSQRLDGLGMRLWRGGRAAVFDHRNRITAVGEFEYRRLHHQPGRNPGNIDIGVVRRREQLPDRAGRERAEPGPVQDRVAVLRRDVGVELRAPGPDLQPTLRLVLGEQRDAAVEPLVGLVVAAADVEDADPV